MASFSFVLVYLQSGGCSHLCLLTSRSSTKRTCACPTGVRLRNDKRNCENGAGNMLFIARKVEIQGISLDTSDHTRVVGIFQLDI